MVHLIQAWTVNG
uniref:Uncharacterized protein n=1 Tax=Lepeophtheirus salmonis TaxID=72036 RepID=A0A0K2U670_LEPSM